MKAQPIRIRLTAWYFGVLAISLLTISLGALLALHQSIYGAVDDELEDRSAAMRRIMARELRPDSTEALQHVLREHSGLTPGGDLSQIADAKGNWLFRSRSMANYGVSPPSDWNHPSQYATAHFKRGPLRVHTEIAVVNGQSYSIQTATSMEDFNEANAKFRWFLIIAVPFLLALATAGGYFMSRRALAPVDAIIDAARNFGAQNLSSRLSVPQTGDELQRLSETLNGMLGRIEIAVARITQFTADASHELRTPLAIMRTRAELALRKQRSEAEYREELQQLLEELERTSDLLERLMLLARADSGAPILQFADVGLVGLLERVCAQAAMLADAKKIHFTSRLPQNPCSVHGDSQFLQRLFLILLDNAVKYTAPEGNVSVICEKANGTATVTVSDSGRGIPQADLPNIFERFYRADKARSRDSGGAGLGLAIAHWIAAAHHGTIEVESIPEQGSTFLVRLPLLAGASGTAERAGARAQS
jgi:heavy metal sensor kinase